ncbi:hypothetical protein C9374_008292 [Naegleria lovaniensis]|uniref:Thiamin pyrophosphokinase thiamin-binding domain-containing protein n=1 Tax=Naegleria lovaniensis TaxID=51637 RepID=A0AA88GLZ4_NAELO|nr:uncharacterized protein C9374_008292 [Naegleria lovaniensis]KAG2378653.1 hypothetical protein C9374_008292 [Naegleria lovaniensis]
MKKLTSSHRKALFSKFRWWLVHHKQNLIKLYQATPHCRAMNGHRDDKNNCTHSSALISYRSFSRSLRFMDSEKTATSSSYRQIQSPTNIVHFAFSQEEDLLTESPKDGVYYKDHLIVLNTPYLDQKLFPRELFEGLWNSCRWKFCADGGANRLFKYTDWKVDNLMSVGWSETTNSQKQYVPDVICGDLDSLDPIIGQFYSKLGTSLMKISEQDSNDLQKCVSILKEKILNDAISSGTTCKNAEEKSNILKQPPTQPPMRTIFHRVFIIGGGGRLDQEMCDLNTLYIEAMAGMCSSSASVSPENNSPSLTIRKEEVVAQEEHHYHHQTTTRSIITTSTEKHALQFILVTPYSLVHVLTPGRHEIYRNSKWERSTCALVPIGIPCRQVVTSGLKWNLKGESLEFGGLVSTSNRMLTDCVTVQNSHPLLWITSLNNRTEEEC